MRFIIIRCADSDTESDAMPSEAVLTAMGAYNQAMIEAGVFRAGEGLRPSSQGARTQFRGGVSTIPDGPFAETKEVIAGFTMIEVGSRAEDDDDRTDPAADARRGQHGAARSRSDTCLSGACGRTRHTLNTTSLNAKCLNKPA